MTGDVIESATVALLEDIVGFFPSPRDRAALERALTAMRNARNKARDLVEKNLDRLIEGGGDQPDRQGGDDGNGGAVGAADV